MKLLNRKKLVPKVNGFEKYWKSIDTEHLLYFISSMNITLSDTKQCMNMLLSQALGQWRCPLHSKGDRLLRWPILFIISYSLFDIDHIIWSMWYDTLYVTEDILYVTYNIESIMAYNLWVNKLLISGLHWAPKPFHLHLQSPLEFLLECILFSF